MRSKSYFFLSIILLFISACQDAEESPVTAFVSYKIGFLEVVADSSGKVSIETSASFTVPTLIGTFSAGIVTEPDKFFQDEGIYPNGILIIRSNGKDYFYDLNGQDFQISFGQGYYENVTVMMEGTNLLIEIIPILTSANATQAIDYGSAIQIEDCPNTLPPRLTIGERGRVIPEPPIANLLRESPSRNGQKIDRIEPGESFEIVDGPVCGGSEYYWKVQTQDGIGWTSEGEGYYYIEPWH